VSNLPFYNVWSALPCRLEFVNREDLLALFDIVEEHFRPKRLAVTEG
jgi:hypothetical protein